MPTLACDSVQNIILIFTAVSISGNNRLWVLLWFFFFACLFFVVSLLVKIYTRPLKALELDLAVHSEKGEKRPDK